MGEYNMAKVARKSFTRRDAYGRFLLLPRTHSQVKTAVIKENSTVILPNTQRQPNDCPTFEDCSFLSKEIIHITYQRRNGRGDFKIGGAGRVVEVVGLPLI
jgi:hypothetical protein